VILEKVITFQKKEKKTCQTYHTRNE